jgi:hypothetical protein
VNDSDSNSFSHAESKAIQVCKQREVVLEIERVKLIRKRMKTSLRFCKSCGRSTDFIQLVKAAGFFEVTPAEIFDFICMNHSHFLLGNEDEIYICLADLLAAMNKRMNIGAVKLLGEKNEETII